MNICIVSGIFPPDIGGPATYLINLCEEIKNLGHKIYIITFGDEYIDFPFPVQKISRTTHPLIRILFAFIKIIKLHKEIDIIFTLGGPWDSGIPALFAKAVLGKPMVTKVTGDIAWERARIKHLIKDDLEQFKIKRYPFKIEFFRWIQKFVVKSADMVIVSCEFSKKIVINWGVRDKIVRLIPNAIDDKPLPINRNVTIKPALNSKNNLLIITMGRLIPLKGIDKLIQLLPELKQNISLIIIGDGPEKRNFELISDMLGVKERVIFTGNLKRQEVFDYLMIADLFVLYSDGESSMPFSVLEAMVCGLPVVASRAGGIPELIEDGVDGILVELKDTDGLKKAICKTLGDGILRSKLISNAYEKVKRYSLKKMTEETLNLFNDILHGGFN